MLDLGMDACGLEPEDVRRAEAIRLHPQPEGRLLAGSIPGELPAGLPSGFDGIVCSAVLMHIPDAGLFNAAYCLRG